MLKQITYFTIELFVMGKKIISHKIKLNASIYCVFFLFICTNRRKEKEVDH